MSLKPRAFVKDTAAPPRSVRAYVVLTDIRVLEFVVKRVGKITADLGIEVQIVVPYVVPYPIALEHPPVPLEFQRNQLTAMLACYGIEAPVCVYLCRDIIDLLLDLTQKDSIIVLGAKKRHLFRTKAHRIARALRQHGREVMLLEAA